MYRSMAIFAFTGALLCGCASITNGSSQKIAIATPPVAGASCTFASNKGRWTVVTPGSVQVEKSVESLSVKCRKPGYEDATAAIAPQMEPLSVASMVFAGPVGIFVDTQTGAINRYPGSFAIPMTPLAQTPPQGSSK